MQAPPPIVMQNIGCNFEDILQYRGLPLIQSRNVIFARLGKKVECCKHISADRCSS